MWYFAWILGVLLACSFGIINVLWLEAQESLDQHTSVLDPLTKLPSRVEFLNQLEQVITELKSESNKFSLMMISFDNYDNLCASKGELELDSALLQFSELIKQEIRNQVDFLARYDAKTFTVILPGAKKAIAEATARHICAACKQSLQAKPEQTIVSIGISEYATQMGRKEDLLKSLLSTTDQHLKAAQSLANNSYFSG